MIAVILNRPENQPKYLQGKSKRVLESSITYRDLGGSETMNEFDVFKAMFQTMTSSEQVRLASTQMSCSAPIEVTKDGTLRYSHAVKHLTLSAMESLKAYA
jgi:hypothetical protein